MRRFGWPDLMVLLVCGVFFAAFVAPLKNRVTHDLFWIKCQANLRAIGLGFHMYAAENGGRFPRTRWDPNSRQVNVFTNPTAEDPFGADGPLANDVTASLYLLIRHGMVDPRAFRCPLNKVGESPLPSASADVSTLSNFPDPKWLTYSMSNPFPPAEVSSNFRWAQHMRGTFPIAADLNPGPSAASRNTPNHYRGKNQSVLYADGHVEQQTEPIVWFDADGESGLDYIYTSGETETIGPPAHAHDAVMFPVASFDPQPLVDPWTSARRYKAMVYSIWYALLAVLVMLLGLRIYQSRELLKHLAVSALTIRARRRAAKGLCRRCGYDLRGNQSGVCPECGTAVAR